MAEQDLYTNENNEDVTRPGANLSFLGMFLLIAIPLLLLFMIYSKMINLDVVESPSRIESGEVHQH